MVVDLVLRRLLELKSCRLRMEKKTTSKNIKVQCAARGP